MSISKNRSGNLYVVVCTMIKRRMSELILKKGDDKIIENRLIGKQRREMVLVVVGLSDNIIT
jgi:hypothetical protein